MERKLFPRGQQPVPPYEAYDDRPSVALQYVTGTLESPMGSGPEETFAETPESKTSRNRRYLIYGGMSLAIIAVVLAVVYTASRFSRG